MCTARMVKLVDTLDLKSSEQQCSCGFKSRSEYKIKPVRLMFNGFFYAYNLRDRSRKELTITETELTLIAAPAIIGDNSVPVIG